jgi:hypothetical protein
VKKFLPWIISILFLLCVTAKMIPVKEPAGFHLNGFGRLPVLLNGRVMPMDTMARLSLFGERQKVGGQAALRSGSCVCGCGLNLGYQRRNRSSRSSLSTFVLVCSKR